MIPIEVEVTTPNTGLRATPIGVFTFLVAVPLLKPVRVVVTVNEKELPGVNPASVTRPVDPIVALPKVVVTAQINFGS